MKITHISTQIVLLFCIFFFLILLVPRSCAAFCQIRTSSHTPTTVVIMYCLNAFWVIYFNSWASLCPSTRCCRLLRVNLAGEISALNFVRYVLCSNRQVLLLCVQRVVCLVCVVCVICVCYVWGMCMCVYVVCVCVFVMYATCVLRAFVCMWLPLPASYFDSLVTSGACCFVGCLSARAVRELNCWTISAWSSAIVSFAW